jgi:hypothetical protein
MSDSRVGVRLSIKLGTSNYGSLGIEVYEERDVTNLSTSTQTRAAILQRLTEEIEEWKKQQTTDTPNKINQPPHDASGPAQTDLTLMDALDRLNWRDTKTKNGWWARLDELPADVRATFANRFINNTTKTLHLGGYNYSRFGDENDMIGRFAAKAK